MDRSEQVLAEYLACERELARALTERDAAIERAARAEAEVQRLRNALWLAQHPSDARCNVVTNTTVQVSEVYVPLNLTCGAINSGRWE